MYEKKRDLKLVNRLTSSPKIKTITSQEARMVLDTFNCFGLGTDMHGHASQFLRDNTLADIRTKWDELLNNGDITAEKVSNCCQLRHFGESSVSELIAWRFPDKYPIMNTCSKKRDYGSLGWMCNGVYYRSDSRKFN